MNKETKISETKLMNYYEYAKAIHLGEDEEIAGLIYGVENRIPVEYYGKVVAMLSSQPLNADRKWEIERMAKVCNYDTPMDQLVQVQYNDLEGKGIKTGYILDYDDTSKGTLPRFVFRDFWTGEITEEYFEEISQITYCGSLLTGLTISKK